MLEGRENESKNATPLVDWLKITENSENAKYLPSDVSYELANFEEFMEKRQKLMSKALKDILLWHLPLLTIGQTENRLFFLDERFEQGLPFDENETLYIGKSIAGLKLNRSAQNPITYLYIPEKDKNYI